METSRLKKYSVDMPIWLQQLAVVWVQRCIACREILTSQDRTENM